MAMNATLATSCGVLLLVLVPAITAARYFAPERLRWWAIVLFVACASWVLMNLAVYYSQAHVNDLVMEAGGFENAPPDLQDDWANDGAPKAFAFMFGWIVGLLLLVPCLALYGIAQLVRTRNARLRSLPSDKSLDQTREG
jgi:hypothetical protein